MPHPRPNNSFEEYDIAFDKYKRARWHYVDLASRRGFKKLDNQYQALLQMLREGRRNADSDMKPFWIKEYQRAIKSNDWVLDNIKEPVDWADARSSTSSSTSSSTCSSPIRDISDTESSDSDTRRVCPKRPVERPAQETFREGLEDDPHKNEINTGLVALARKWHIKGSALVLDAPESKLSSKALVKAGFTDVDVPNCVITAKDARALSSLNVHWYASYAFEHLATTPKIYEFMYLDYCGSFLSHMKDVVLAINKLEKGHPVLFATTFATSRIPSEFKHQWKTEHVHYIQALFDGSLNVKVLETQTFEYSRAMITNVWILERS